MSHTRTFIFFLVVLLWSFSGSGLFAQSNFFASNAWETLPVFHNGRVMPLHTFARQVVREICGTERPFLVRDDAVTADFAQVLRAFQRQQDPAGQEEGSSRPIRFLNPDASLDGGFDRHYSPYQLASGVPQISTALPILGLDRPQIERLDGNAKLLQYNLIETEGFEFHVARAYHAD